MFQSSLLISVMWLVLLLVSFDTTTTAFVPPFQSFGVPRAVMTRRMSSNDNDVDTLREKAAQLRQEVDQIERQKRAVELEETRKLQDEKAAREAYKDRYSAVVPILKPDGTTAQERCEFPPRHANETSYITVCEANLPLGILLGESEIFQGAVAIDEIADGSNGAKAGAQVGDLLRACTATKMDMEAPAWQLIAGGIGIPKTKRFMYSVDGRPFEEVMEAIGSNRLDPEQRPVLLVVERLQEE